MRTGTISENYTLRRRGRLVRRSRRLDGRRRATAAAALHREEPGEPEDQQVERADHCYSEVQIETRASTVDSSELSSSQQTEMGSVQEHRNCQKPTTAELGPSKILKG